MITGFIARFQDLNVVYTWIASLVAAGLIVSSLEDIVNRAIYASTGLLSWKVSKHSSYGFLRGRFSRLCSFFLNDRAFNYLLYLKLLLSIVFLGLAIAGIFSSLLIFALLFLMLTLSLRSQYGLDGSHQMSQMVLLALGIAACAGIHSTISSICLWFLSGELILSYFVAGLNKFISPIWRKTHALNAIFSTKTYGNEILFKLITKNQLVAVALCWPMILFELFFFTALFSEYTLAAFCIVGVLFHLFNALVMGLNTFLFAFLSTYPAIFYCFTKIHPV